MKVDRRSRWQYRIQSGVFVVLFVALLGVLAWMSERYSLVFDLSANQRNSLSQETERLVAAIEHPLEIVLFVSPINESKPLLEALFERYARLQPKIEYRSLNPDLVPEMLREHDVRYDGEVLLRYQGRVEKVTRVSEATVSSAIQRLLRQGERWLVFIEGHGERHPYREANHDLSQFASQLANRGFRIESLNLMQQAEIPDNTSVLVLASPRIPLLPGEVELLRGHIEGGGNLLWLADPGQAGDGLDVLFDALEIGSLPGVIVDPNSQLMGLDRIDFALIGEYPQHPVTRGLASLSLFPEAQALESYGDGQWLSQAFLQTDRRSWNETGELRGEIRRGDDDDESAGPLTVGLTLSRSRADADDTPHEQRVAVVGDADFLSNRYLGNGSNLEIGLNLVNWLSHDDSLIAISPRPAPDTRLDLTPTQQLLIALGFLFVLPLALVGSGLRIWLKRRKR